MARRGEEKTAEGDSSERRRVSTVGEALGVPGSDMVPRGAASGVEPLVAGAATARAPACGVPTT